VLILFWIYWSIRQFSIVTINEVGIKVKGFHRGYIQWNEITSFETFSKARRGPQSKHMVLNGVDGKVEFQSDFIKNYDALQSSIYWRIKDRVTKVE